VFTASGGKVYYPAPALAALFAVGAVRMETVEGGRSRVRWTVSIVVSGLIAGLIGLPVLPPAVASALRPINPNAMETYGWPLFVDQITRATATLPADTTIFTSNYGEAGALTLLGPAAGLHTPVYSAHNAYGYWGPPPGRPDSVLCVGEWDMAYLHRFWSQVREIAPLTLPDGLQDEETTQHAAIYLCQQPHGSWAQLWPALRHLD
jgi:hypothetical protein